MIMTIQRYSIKVRYGPGTEIVIADTLSRATIDGQPEERNQAPYEDYEISAIKGFIIQGRFSEDKSTTIVGEFIVPDTSTTTPISECKLGR